MSLARSNKLVIVFIFVPLLLLGLFVLDQFIFHQTGMFFWVGFLLSLIPFGTTGLILSIISSSKSIEEAGKLNKVIGIAGILVGIAYIIGGLLGVLLIYLVVQ